ncbi:unnamed protein product [Allacma fusca]|uniref:Uncharacterized protein n=1 Tax=Allacma fusca TaxID=39272 RepID=A0A8J2PMD3_9HEXA|nr:unnamed protein product [Allacma fusca]
MNKVDGDIKQLSIVYQRREEVGLKVRKQHEDSWDETNWNLTLNKHITSREIYIKTCLIPPNSSMLSKRT